MFNESSSIAKLWEIARALHNHSDNFYKLNYMSTKTTINENTKFWYKVENSS